MGDYTDDEVEAPVYRRLRRVNDDDVISISSDESYNSMDDFIVPDEAMMDVDGEEDPYTHLKEQVSKYKRSPERQAITELEVILGSKYSSKRVYDLIPAQEELRSYDLDDIGKKYYTLYDKNKTDPNSDAMQYYLYAAYCYWHTRPKDRWWIINEAQSKSAHSELLKVYRIVNENSNLLHYARLTKSDILRF